MSRQEAHASDPVVLTTEDIDVLPSWFTRMLPQTDYVPAWVPDLLADVGRTMDDPDTVSAPREYHRMRGAQDDADKRS